MTFDTYAAPAGARDEAAFLSAWKRGVQLAGPRFFGDRSNARRYGKWKLEPNGDLIERSIGMLPFHEAILLAAMVSFYNGSFGGDLLASALGRKRFGLADITANLGPQHRRVIADLFLSYEGW